MASTDLSLCTFDCQALPLARLLVASWQGEEQLSRPYRYEAVLATANALFDESALLGQTACLTLTDPEGKPHLYHGIVTRVEQLDSDALYGYCRIVLEPRMTRLRLERFSEIWLDKNLPELVRDILKGAGLAAEGPGPNGDGGTAYDFDLRLRDEDVARTQTNFVCQYEETSFDFLSRLLEHHGCYYFFEQQQDHEALVICNDRSFQVQTPLPLRYRPLDSALDSGRQPVVNTFTSSASVQPAQVVLQDFSATHAQLALRAGAFVAAGSVAPAAGVPQDSAAFSGYHGVYGDHFGSHAQGSWLAGLRAQALGCRHRLFRGSGRAAGLRAGGKMTLTGHPRLALNDDYQVLEVRHAGRQPLPGTGEDSAPHEVQTQFVAIPASLQFRPALDTPRPNANGMITAIIDGDSDSKPLLNEHGCYKVRFPFIRGDKKATRGSAWLRMASPSTGSSHGMHFPLLEGTEVLISFLGGDPDRPIITGSLPNSENPNKVTESNATQSGFASPGGHYFAMDDDPTGPLMKLSAPGARTSFTLGNGQVQGAHLRTDAALHLSSNSLNHRVGSSYSFKVEPLGDQGEMNQAQGEMNRAQEDKNQAQEQKNQAQEDKNEAQEEKNQEYNALLPTEEWVNKRWDVGPKELNAGVKVGWSNARTITIELNTAVEQFEVGLGLVKQEIKAQGLSAELNVAGPSVAANLNVLHKEYHNRKHSTSPLIQTNVLIQKVQTRISKLETELYEVQCEIHELAATTSISLKNEQNHITLNELGIEINSRNQIILSGDVIIKGNTVMTKGLCVQDEVQCHSVSAMGKIEATDIESEKLKATSATFGAPCFPPIPSAEIAEALVSAEAFTALQATVEALTKTLSEAAEVPLQEMSAEAKTISL